MSDSAESPGSLPESPPEDSSSPPPKSSTSPPPPPDDDSPSAPPPTSKTSPPPPSDSSPPPDSNTSPPSPPPPKSESPPPTPPPPSPSPPPPPPPSSGSGPPKPPPPSHSNSSPPPPPTSPPPAPIALSPPPTPTQTAPPPSPTPPTSPSPPPPAEAFTPPPPSTPTPTPSTPNPTPSTDTSPPTPTTSHVPPPPPSDRVPSSSTPSRTSSPEKSSQSSGSGSSTSSQTGPVVVVGVTVAGVVILALVAIFFVVSRRKKKHSGVIPAKYNPPTASYSVKSNGHYYGQQPMGMSAPYGSQHSLSQHGNGNNYGSQGGQMYYPGGPESGVIGGAKSLFTYEELMEITNGFSRQNIIGEGGFGYVYKGWLPDGRVVAVKQLKAGSGQGEREFRAEVEIISRVHHRHLVSLVGYSIAENQRLLLYEFLPNKTLEHHLHGKELPVLDWTKRLKIAIGSARGLAYLHEDCNPKIIHRDIKSANILLDDDFEAQVADFGLAKPSNDNNTHVSTRVMGTFGYMAPEYASSGKLTDRSDVFSFGVVLLELITGRKPVDPTQPLGDESLVEWARPLLIHALETGDVSELIDPRLEHRYVESEMLRMIETAAACVRHSAPKRPRMAKVVRALDSEGESTDLTNGVKYGQSTIYDSGQYNQDIQRFRRMALGDDSSEYDMYSGEYQSKEVSLGAPTSSTLTESETQAMNGK
ncbi:hypothetical protein AAG906_035180 [Vitis piasezkii]